jgi:formylglycine-generating enzyme required for sulfatase activity
MYEFVAGGTLADAVLGWHALTPAERFNRTVPILYTVAHAVGCGHAVRPAVVHRDLKPANVLMAGDVPRITDYGIGGVAVAFQVAEERAGTLTGKINRLPAVLSGAYSLMYSSPQQRAGDRPDPRDDVHALGVMAYQMLVGRVDKEVKGNWQDRLAADGVPTALISLIGRSASDEADDRPADARAWEAALADFLLPVAADIDEALPAPARAKPAAVPRAAPVPPKSAAVPRAAPVPPKPAAAARAPEPAKPPARAPGEGVEFPLPRGLTMAFCWIPPGTARLGSPPAEQAAVERALGARPDWLAAEGEARRGAYTTAGFWLGKRPVTQDEWHALTGEMPSYFRAGGGGAGEVKGLDTTRFPVEQVSWDAICGAGGFLAKLNALGGTKRVFGAAVTFALPHEDAWEYACRGGRGNGQPFYFGPELNGARANVDGNNPFGTAAKGPYAKRPTPVGRYEPAAPHPWGLCDLHGNVWEWCANRHERTRYPVLRGGSWNDSACHGRAASRNGGAPAVASWNIGFRVVAAG